MGDGFRHEALFYGARDEFLDGTTTFIREGLAARAPVLVVVDDEKIGLLRTALGDDAASRVEFADMREAGATRGGSSPCGRTSSTATRRLTASGASASRSPPSDPPTSSSSATATRPC